VQYTDPYITKVGGQLSRSDGLNSRWKLTVTKPECTRKRRRSSVSRLDVTEHLQIKSLKDEAQDRNQWYGIVEVVRG
jgi:hypothetical protein